jgi:hypothetical protein
MSLETLLALAEELQLRYNWEQALYAEVESQQLRMAA